MPLVKLGAAQPVDVGSMHDSSQQLHDVAALRTRLDSDGYLFFRGLLPEVISYFLVFVPTIREIRDFYREM